MTNKALGSFMQEMSVNNKNVVGAVEVLTQGRMSK
jgi:hypothetical protein